MAPQKSPAFQFYPKDFMAGTATMSLQEVGAYMRLLCYAWDTGSVPTDPNERARICVCSKSQERELWKKVGKKFILENDAYFNERLEDERKKQSEYRRRQSDAGKASAATRRQPEGNHGSTTVEARLDSGSNQKATLLSSSSSSSSKEQEPKTTKECAVGLIASPLQFARLQETHAYVSDFLKVPNKLHAELVGKSGANADAKLRAWYDTLRDELAESGKGTGDIFEFLRPRHQAHALAQGWIDAPPKPSAGTAKPFSVLDAMEREKARKAGIR